MLLIELALRGQENPTQELLEFRYREMFGLSEEQLGNESIDTFNLNIAIMSKIAEINKEEADHKESFDDRLNR